MESDASSSMMEPIGSFTQGSSGSSSSGWSIWWILGCIICVIVLLVVSCHCWSQGEQQTKDTPIDLRDDLQHERPAQSTNNLEPEPEPHDSGTSIKGGQPAWCFIGDDGDKRVCGQGASCQSGAAFLTQEACLRAE